MKIKEKILIEVATSTWLTQASKNICANHSDDLKQHLLLILCEMPDSKIVQLYNDGYLKYFCIKVMLKQSNSPRQQFAKQFASIGMVDVYDIDLQFIDTLEDAEVKEVQLTTIEKVVQQNHWYEREIFSRYMNGESARSIHRKTKIALREILKVIKKIKEDINNEYNN